MGNRFGGLCPYHSQLPAPALELLTEFKRLRDACIPGAWAFDGEAFDTEHGRFVFEAGDPETAFVEFCSKHADDLIDIVTHQYKRGE